MTRYRIPTIKEKGGLKVHVTDMGYDYKLLSLLMLAKIPNTAIRAVLRTERERRTGDAGKLAAATVGAWKDIYREERRTRKQEHEDAVKALKNL